MIHCLNDRVVAGSSSVVSLSLVLAKPRKCTERSLAESAINTKSSCFFFFFYFFCFGMFIFTCEQ